MDPDLHKGLTIATRLVVSGEWQEGLPPLSGGRVALREPRAADAASLFAMLATEEVARFISPPPSTVEAFERFIAWSVRKRKLATHLCYAVTLDASDAPIGIFQVRSLEPGFGVAEWGFALGSEYWGTGVFVEAAELVMRFAFETVGVHRLEARSVVRNGRGNGALSKIGAVQEGLLRRSFLRNGEYVDQVLWSILERDRLREETNPPRTSHIH